MLHSLTISERSCESRFCSTTNTKSCSPMKLVDARMEREGAHAQAVEHVAFGSSMSIASSIAGDVEPK